MKIAVAGGHSKAAPGASKYLDEYECDRAYVKNLIPALEKAGHNVVNCSNEKTTQGAELAEEVRIANASGADVFAAWHLNDNSKDPNSETTGTEVWYYEGNDNAKKLAEDLSANIAAALGVKNRGAKPTKNLYVLRNTDMLAVLVELCFVDDKDDAEAWHRTPWNDLTKAAVDAFAGIKTTASNKTASVSAPAKPATNAAKPAAKPASNVQQWIRDLQTECNKQGFSKQAVDGIAGPNTLAGCPTLRKGAKGNITKIMQQRLVALGYSVGKCGADGSFGSGTLSGVKAFQKAMGLTVDGVVGPNTWRKLLGL